MNFKTLNRNVKSVISKLDEITLDSAMECKETIADLNVAQMTEGKRNDGKNIVPEYQSESYAIAKKAIGAKPPKYTPDLKLTGDFHAGVYAKKYATVIETESSDSKNAKLIEKYPKIFGLTKESQKVLNQEIQPKLTKKIKHELTTS